MNDSLRETATALQQEWGLQLPQTFSEEDILQQLADRLGALIEKGPEAFFQLMYRLDISEKKLTASLQDEDVAGKIARLIYDRQLQKIESRKRHSTPKPEDDELAW
jgi:hypothetical protein